MEKTKREKGMRKSSWILIRERRGERGSGKGVKTQEEGNREEGQRRRNNRGEICNAEERTKKEERERERFSETVLCRGFNKQWKREGGIKGGGRGIDVYCN